MPNVNFDFHNATAANVNLINYMPAAGWIQAPPAMLPAFAGVPAQAIFADTGTAIVITYDPNADAHNVLFLPATAVAPASVDATANVNAVIQPNGADYDVTLTFL